MAGKIPQAFIDEVLIRTDLVTLIGARVPLRRAGHNFVGCCPFHTEKTPSFSVSPDKQFYYCFGCQAHGNALTFLLQHDKLDFLDALRTLADDAGLALPETEHDERSQQRQQILNLLRDTNRYYQRQLRDHAQRLGAVSYLQGRGITGAAAAAFELGFAPPGWHNLLEHFGSGSEALLQAAGLIAAREGKHYDRLRDRVVFPIHDVRGNVVGFGGRVLDNSEPKYLNSPETLVFHKGQELYGLYQTRRCSTRLERLIVVEGYLDVVALAQAGIAGVVATLGTALSADHVRKLFQFVPQLVFCFDGDRAGYQAAWKALEQVIPLLDEVRAAYFLLLPPGEDPDTLVRKAGAADFEQRLAAALPVPEFILHHLTERHDPRQPEAQRRLLAAAQPLFRQLPVGPLREVLLSQMSQRLGMERAGLLAALIANDTPPAMVAARPPRPSAAMPSITRLAVQCLLHHPEWATTAELPPVCQTVTWEGLDLLQALLAALVVTPQPTITALITRWQDHAWGRIVAQLASTELPISGTQQEWLDLCQQLALLCAQQRVQHLAAKGLAALTADERHELQRLSQRSYGA